MGNAGKINEICSTSNPMQPSCQRNSINDIFPKTFRLSHFFNLGLKYLHITRIHLHHINKWSCYLVKNRKFEHSPLLETVTVTVTVNIITRKPTLYKLYRYIYYISHVFLMFQTPR